MGSFDNNPLLTELIIGKNPIGPLSDGILDNLPELEYLNIEGSQISELPPDLFANTLQVAVIVITSNPQLTELPPGIFSNLTELEYLDLSANALVTLPAPLFSPVLTSESQLVLLYYNELDRLPDGLFAGESVNLAHLYLVRNQRKYKARLDPEIVDWGVNPDTNLRFAIVRFNSRVGAPVTVIANVEVENGVAHQASGVPVPPDEMLTLPAGRIHSDEIRVVQNNSGDVVRVRYGHPSMDLPPGGTMENFQFRATGRWLTLFDQDYPPSRVGVDPNQEPPDVMPKPANLTATVVYEGVSLNWEHPQLPSTAGYQILRRQVGAQDDLTLYAPNVKHATMTFTDRWVEEDQTYHYAVRAVHTDPAAQDGRTEGPQSDMVPVETTGYNYQAPRRPATRIPFVDVDPTLGYWYVKPSERGRH